jgi:Sec-independent protein secretion pathway component TatC
MTTKHFILFSSGVFLMGVLYSYFMSKNIEQAIEKSPKTEH